MLTQHAHATEQAMIGAAIASVERGKWRCQYRLEKRLGDWSDLDVLAGIAPDPYEVIEGEGNALMQAGANALWTALTAGIGTLFNNANAQLVVGDSSTANSGSPPTYTDLLAAAGSTLNTGDITAATNASPIVLTAPGWTTQPAVGDVVVVAGVNGNTAANGTFEVSAATTTTATLLNSTGNGAFTTSAGSTVKHINKYRMVMDATFPTVTNNQVQFRATITANNGNFAWNEWGVTTGGAATNKQAAPPPSLLNRAVQALGTKAQGSSWTLLVTITLT